MLEPGYVGWKRSKNYLENCGNICYLKQFSPSRCQSQWPLYYQPCQDESLAEQQITREKQDLKVTRCGM